MPRAHIQLQPSREAARPSHCPSGMPEARAARCNSKANAWGQCRGSAKVRCIWELWRAGAPDATLGACCGASYSVLEGPPSNSFGCVAVLARWDSDSHPRLHGAWRLCLIRCDSMAAGIARRRPQSIAAGLPSVLIRQFEVDKLGLPSDGSRTKR